MTEDRPFGATGDLIESLVPVATRLIEAVRNEGPDAVHSVLASVPQTGPDDQLPGGNMGALAVVLAAMVDPDAGMRKLLGWTAAMLPDAPTPQQRESARLQAAGVNEHTAQKLAQQAPTRRRTLHIVHGRRATA